MRDLALSASAAQAPARVPEALALRTLIWRRFRRHRMALMAVGVLAIIILSALLASLSPYGPTQIDPARSLEAPSAAHWFGTDDLGRDLFTRVLYGGRISLTVGLVSTLLALAVGVLIGMVAGYAGGWLDNALMRVTDAFLTLPTLFVLILIATLLRESPALSVGSSVTVVIAVSQPLFRFPSQSPIPGTHSGRT